MECYYCDLDILHDCDAEKVGNPVTCQFTNSSLPHYGDACMTSHSGSLAKFIWVFSFKKCKIVKIRSAFYFYSSHFLLFHIEGNSGELWERKCFDSNNARIPGAMPGCIEEEAGGVKTHACKCNTDLCNGKFTETTETTPNAITSTSTSKPG